MTLKAGRGFDRVLIAVAATFVALSAGSALAQSASQRSPADLAIDAGVPIPEPANVPPPSIGDFKMDSAVTPPAADDSKAKAAAAPETAAPAATAAAPAAEPAKEALKEP